MNHRIIKGWALTILVAIVAGCDFDPGLLAQPEPSPMPTVDRSAMRVLEKRAGKALLDDSDMPFKVDRHLAGIDRVGGRLQHACGAWLPSDAYEIAEDGDSWRAVLPEIVDQVAIGYDRPVAADIVGQARAVANCGEYRERGATFTYVSEIPIEAPKQGAVYGFCEYAAGNNTETFRCTVLTGRGRLSCATRTWAPTEARAREMVEALMPTILKKCMEDPI